MTYSIGASFVRALYSFILVWLLTKYMSAEQFAEYATISGFGLLLLALLGLGTGHNYSKCAVQTFQIRKSFEILDSNMFYSRMFFIVPVGVLVTGAFSAIVNIELKFSLTVFLYITALHILNNVLGKFVAKSEFRKYFFIEALFRLIVICVLHISLYYTIYNWFEYFGLFTCVFSLTLMWIVFEKGKFLTKACLQFYKSSFVYFINTISEVIFWRGNFIVLPFIYQPQLAGELQLIIVFITAALIVPQGIYKYFWPKLVRGSKNYERYCKLFVLSVGVYIVTGFLFLEIAFSVMTVFIPLFSVIVEELYYMGLLISLISVTRAFKVDFVINDQIKVFNKIYFFALVSSYAFLIVLLYIVSNISLSNILTQMIFCECLLVLGILYARFKKKP